MAAGELNDYGRPSLLLQSFDMDPMINESSMDAPQIDAAGSTATAKKISALRNTVHTTSPTLQQPSIAVNMHHGQPRINVGSIDLAQIGDAGITGTAKTISAAMNTVHSSSPSPQQPSMVEIRQHGHQIQASHNHIGGKGQIKATNSRSEMGVIRSTTAGTVHSAIPVRSLHFSSPPDPMVCESMLVAQKTDFHRNHTAAVAINSDSIVHQTLAAVEGKITAAGTTLVAAGNFSAQGCLDAQQQVPPPNPNFGEHSLAAQKQHTSAMHDNNSKVWQKSFRDVLNASVGCNGGSCSNSMPAPQRKGDLMAIKVDPTEHQSRLKYFENALIGKLMLTAGDKPWTHDELRSKLQQIWKPKGSWLLSSMGKGYYTFRFSSLEERDRIWRTPVPSLKPGTLRLQQWTPMFNPYKAKTTTAQVWVRFYELGTEHYYPNLLWNLARCIGIPLKIDQRTLEGSHTHFARILVEVDLAKPLESHVLIEHGDGSCICCSIGFERMPDFCKLCDTVGHSIANCRRKPAAETQVKEDQIRGRSKSRRRHPSWRPKAANNGGTDMPHQMPATEQASSMNQEASKQAVTPVKQDTQILIKQDDQIPIASIDKEFVNQFSNNFEFLSKLDEADQAQGVSEAAASVMPATKPLVQKGKWKGKDKANWADEPDEETDELLSLDESFYERVNFRPEGIRINTSVKNGQEDDAMVAAGVHSETEADSRPLHRKQRNSVSPNVGKKSKKSAGKKRRSSKNKA